MRAAAAGNSTLGIPKSVGQDFSAADPGGKLPAHAPSSSVEALTGMPSGKKKTRRGGGRHKAAKPKVSADEHLKNVTAAMKKGDTASAKISALHLANALHKAAAKPQAPQSPQPSLADDVEGLGI